MTETPTLSKEAEKLFDDTFHIDRVGWRGRGNDCHVAEIFPYDDEGRQVVPDVADLKQVISQIEQSAIKAERERNLQEVKKYIQITPIAMSYKKTGDRYIGMNNALYWLKTKLEKAITESTE